MLIHTTINSGVMQRTLQTSSDCIKYENYKKNPDFSPSGIIQYKDAKDGCGYDIFINILKEMANEED